MELSSIDTAGLIATLAAMDALVDKASKAVDPELPSEVDGAETNAKKAYEDIMGNSAFPSEHQAQLKDVMGKFDKVIADSRKVFKLIPLPVQDEKALSDLDDSIDSTRVNMSKTLAAIIAKTIDAEAENDKQSKAMALKILTAQVVFVLLLTAFVILVVNWAMKNAVAPIFDAIGLAKSVCRGDLEHTLKARTNDEIGELIFSLNELTKIFRDRSDVAKKVANGDLRLQMQPLSNEDDFGKSLNAMIENLRTVVINAQKTSDKVTSMVKQVNEASLSVTESATNQAASMEQISSSMTDLSNQVRSNASNANTASATSQQANAAAIQGKTQIQSTVSDMKKLSEVSSKISKIIRVIDDIAFQTNLLALNAAVEAARAGKHGKGFAVVAEEVRTLASRSADAAKETSELIEDSQRKVGNSLEQVLKSAEIFDEIVNDIAQANSLVTSISDASSSQALAIAQIEQAMAQINNSTIQTTARAQESFTASQELSTEAVELKNILGQFRA